MAETLRQFEYLVTVADEGSFTAAAEVLRVTQPALSHQIRALELSLGAPLFERLPRAVRLTPVGRAVLPHARAALAEADRLRTVARRAAGLAEGELEVAAVYSVSLGLLPPVLRAWRERHPGVRVRLREYAHADLLRAETAAGRADVAIGPAPADWDGPVRELGVEEFVLVLAQDDPLAAAAAAAAPAAAGGCARDAGGAGAGPAADDDAPVTLALARLAERPWVHYAPGNGLAEILDQACARAGFRPRIAVRAEQTAAAPLLAAAGLGPALVPACVVPAHLQAAVCRPEPPIRRTLTAYTRGGPDPVTSAFIALLAEHADGDLAGGGLVRQSRGSTGSDSSARTANTASCTR